MTDGRRIFNHGRAGLAISLLTWLFGLAYIRGESGALLIATVLCALMAGYEIGMVIRLSLRRHNR